MKISVVHPFYNHNFAIDSHIEHWNQWSSKYKETTEIIIVDDGSPERIDIDKFKKADSGLGIKVFRIKENILWNVTGARNLGITQAIGEWLFPLDFDMIVLDETFKGFDQEEKDLNVTYWPNLWFPTERRPDRMRQPHCNSFFIAREKMLEAGLYDEDFSGMWGWEDSFLHNISLPGVGLKRSEMEVGRLLWRTSFACQHVEKNPKDFSTDNYQKYLAKEKLYNQGQYKNGPILRFEWERLL